MRKPIQVSTIYVVPPNLELAHQSFFLTTVVCDDGTIWRSDSVGSGWFQLPDIPQPEQPQHLEPTSGISDDDIPF